MKSIPGKSVVKIAKQFSPFNLYDNYFMYFIDIKHDKIMVDLDALLVDIDACW